MSERQICFIARTCTHTHSLTQHTHHAAQDKCPENYHGNVGVLMKEDTLMGNVLFFCSKEDNELADSVVEM